MSDTPKPERHWSWRIDSLDDAYRVARESFGGILFLISCILGAFVESTSLSALPRALNAADIGGLIGVLVQAVLVAFYAYRVRIGAGWLAGPIMVLLHQIDIWQGFATGALKSPLAMIFHAAIFASLVMGSIACWQVRQRLARGEVRAVV
jgi:hypothetical protein